MTVAFRWRFLTIVSFFLLLPLQTAVSAEPVKMNSSTQFIWGDDLLGESQAILAQYLRVSISPDDSKISFTGYGRLWDDFGNGKIRESDQVSGRLYYLYLDIAPARDISLRLGRQYLNFSSGSSLMDGASVSLKKIGNIGITAAAGRDVKFSLDSERSRLGNYFIGADIHLVDVRNTQLGVSYVRKYNDWDLSREEFGVNFRYIYKYVSPYAQVRYDRLSKAVDEATVGVDLFPLSNLMIKGEFYHSFPTFDSTSIFSVFAVDKYREYLIRAEYSLNAPVTLFASYARQAYQDGDNADNYILGARFFPLKDLTVSASVDYRHGFGGNLWGFEVTGDYRVNNKILVSAGVQYDSYHRPDFEEDNYDFAQRYWLGAQYLLNKNMSLSARFEDNVNENFNHRPLGRVALNWNL